MGEFLEKAKQAAQSQQEKAAKGKGGKDKPPEVYVPYEQAGLDEEFAQLTREYYTAMKLASKFEARRKEISGKMIEIIKAKGVEADHIGVGKERLEDGTPNPAYRQVVAYGGETVTYPKKKLLEQGVTMEQIEGAKTVTPWVAVQVGRHPELEPPKGKGKVSDGS